MPLWLTYLLLALCAGTLGAGIWFGRREAYERWPRLHRASTVLVLASFVAAYLVLRPGRGDDLDAEIRTAAAQNKPLFVDLYSNF